jgi:quercetin dioxygenase-like cupin family protein
MGWELRMAAMGRNRTAKGKHRMSVSAAFLPFKSQCGRNEHQVHREVFRPWGQYDSIDHGSRYQVKRITVKPGQKLSLQMHHHRAEHWIVVKGIPLELIEVQVGSHLGEPAQQECGGSRPGEQECAHRLGVVSA